MNRLARALQPQGEDQPALAVGAMLFGLSCLSLQDALGKILTTEMSLWQFQGLRALLNVAFVLALARVTMRGIALRPVNPKVVFVRSLFHVLALVCFFSSAPFLTLAEMAGALYTFPLFVAIFGALFLGEPVGARRVTAIILGFVGTLLMLRPDADSFRLVLLLPVSAGLNYAIFIVITRRHCQAESPIVLTLISNVTIFACALIGVVSVLLLNPSEALTTRFPFVLSAWLPVFPWMIAVLCLCTVFNVFGNICLSKAYQSAESSFLAPFDYSYLVFAAFWGFVFWRDVPQPMTIAGMLLVAGSGIFVAWRERALRKSST